MFSQASVSYSLHEEWRGGYVNEGGVGGHGPTGRWVLTPDMGPGVGTYPTPDMGQGVG